MEAERLIVQQRKYWCFQLSFLPQLDGAQAFSHFIHEGPKKLHSYKHRNSKLFRYLTSENILSQPLNSVEILWI